MRPLLRVAGILSVFAALALPRAALAGKNTYCVGGFAGQEACNTASVASQHQPWHSHNCVSDGEHAYHCWDEEDDSCDTNFIASHRSRGWKVVDAYECGRLPAAPANDIAAHVSLGRQIVDAMQAEQQRQAEMKALMEAARQEAARLAAQQEAAREAAEAARQAELQRQEQERQRQAALEAQREAERLAREATEKAEKERLEKLAQEAREKAEREAAEAAAAARKAQEEEAARKAAEEAARLAKAAADADTARQAAELAAAMEAARKAKALADSQREANKPVPVALRTEIVRLSPGPYAAGDVVQVVARIVGPDGRIRGAGGGEGTRTAADGTTKSERANPNADGTFTVAFTLPAGGDVDVSVVGQNPRLLPRETVQGAISPANSHLSVSPCRLRTRLVSPQNGAASTPGATALKGELVDASGKPADAAALNGAKLAFTVESSAGDKLRADAAVGAGGAVAGTVELPQPKGDDKLTFALVAEGGAGDVCPGASVETSLSVLGVAIDLSTLPKKCYAGRPCPVDVTIRLPDDPKSRPIAEAFADAPELKADASLGGGEPVALAKGEANSLHGEIVPPAPGDQEVTFRVVANGKTVEAKGMLPVRWPLQLKAPVELALGAIEAGTKWTQTCRPLVFDGSTGLEEQDVKITAEAPPGCTAELVGNFGGLQAKYRDGVTLEMDASRSIPVCIVAPPCGTSETQAIKLKVAAVNREFADQQAEISVKYEVRGKGFLACNLWWIAAIAGVFAFGAFAYGFVSPFDFGGDDVLRVANKEAALPRAVARRLRELPGGKSGWYRSASFGVRSDGSITDKTGTAALVFTAKRGDLLVSARGGLQRLNARTHKLEPVPDPQSHSLTKNAVYESGGLFFKVS